MQIMMGKSNSSLQGPQDRWPCTRGGEKKDEEEEKEGKMALKRLHQPARTTSSTCTRRRTCVLHVTAVSVSRSDDDTMTVYDASHSSTRQCRNPSTINNSKRPFIIVQYHVSPEGASFPPGQPYGRTIGADLFQLGSLGQAQTRKPQLPQIPIPNPPIPKNSPIFQPELSHLLPNTTTTIHPQNKSILLISPSIT